MSQNIHDLLHEFQSISLCMVLLPLFFKMLAKNYAEYKDFKRYTSLSNAREDYILLMGKVKKQDALLEAPLSKKKCVGYRHISCDKKNRRIETVVYFHTEMSRFILEDAAGGCCLILCDDKTKFHTGKLLAPSIFFGSEINPLVAVSKNISTKAPFFKKSYRYYESCLQENDIVCVEGYFKKTNDIPGVKGTLSPNEQEKKPIVVYYGNLAQLKKRHMIIFFVLWFGIAALIFGIICSFLIIYLS